MWACLQDQETPGHWKHVAGWRKVCDLAQTHLRRLQQYRSGLAEAWPPATNAAARTYLGELDELISKVQHTHDTAAANHDALAAAARAIDSTRPELKRLYDDYAGKLTRKRGYEATLADPKAAAGSRVVDPPVTDADLEKLNVQARGIMFGLSGELQQAQAMLQKPSASPPRLPSKDPSNSDIYGSTGPAIAIPPIVPVPTSGSSGANSSRSPAIRQNAPTPPTPRSGPVLGSTGVASRQPVTPGTSSPPSVGPPPNGRPPSSLPPITPLPGRPNHTQTQKWLNANPIQPFTEGHQGVPQRTPPPQMPSNGVIGGTPGMGFTQQPGNPPPRRINPIGGVIGGGAAGTTPTGGAGSRPGGGRQPGGTHIPPLGGGPTGTTGSMPGGSGRSGRFDETNRRWNPDQPWEVEEGVTPIVRPPDDGGPIDPGPAIGFNR
ncbi:hypothetical protein GA0070216_1109 [Micromonospora matsumotoense]|uniref:PPE family protein n=1 Tax=Micromonospora matsumotoense TaxID=121616 RepID=A0A1C4ZJA7_9ACTN|nr:hypothetical protein GA0070216_1109 [Micromonospora matsumotoense]